MNPIPFAAQQFGDFNFVHLAISVIIIVAVVCIVFVVTRAMGMSIPPWVIQVGVILLAAFVGIVAILALVSFW